MSKHKNPPSGLTKNQGALIDAINKKSLIITYGSAGTGKSFLSAAYAASFLNTGKVKKIIITRPNIPTGKSLGYFPGDLGEKMAPWVAPILQTLKEHLDDDIDLAIKRGKIQIIPFETIRGWTFDNAFVILDEAQNTSIEEMKAFVTRLGENSTTIINGDITQTDIKGKDNGLNMLLDIIVKRPKQFAKDVATINFTSDDIVRSELCKAFVKAFEDLYV